LPAEFITARSPYHSRLLTTSRSNHNIYIGLAVLIRECQYRAYDIHLFKYSEFSIQAWVYYSDYHLWPIQGRLQPALAMATRERVSCRQLFSSLQVFTSSRTHLISLQHRAKTQTSFLPPYLNQPELLYLYLLITEPQNEAIRSHLLGQDRLSHV
jgi:hypothetical protein